MWGLRRPESCHRDIIRKHAHTLTHIKTQYQAVHILINSISMIKHDSLSSHPRLHEEEIVFQVADTKSLIITLFEENKGALNKQMRVIITWNMDWT